MKVYVSGAVVGSYRAQNIIKVLGDGGFCYIYFPDNFSRIKLKSSYFRRFIYIVLILLTFPVRLLMIVLSTHFIVLPMNFGLIPIVEVCFARIFKKKIIVDYYISKYDTLVNDRKEFEEGSFGAKLALFEDKLLLNSASRVVFLNRSESEYYQNIAGVEVEEINKYIIPLCVDYKKEMFRRNSKSGTGVEFNVCWWGTYIPLHGLEHLIKAFDEIENKNIKLYIFGNSEKKSEPYREMLKRYNLTERVTVINDFSFSNGKLSPFLKENCDLAIGNFGSSEKAKTVLVNKLVDALSLGLPCLTMETKATKELLENNEGIILTKPNPTDISKSIELAFENKKNLAEIGRTGQEKYFNVFSPDAFKVKFLSLLNS